MPESRSHRGWGLALAVLAAALLVLAPSAGATSTAGLSGWLSSAPVFPQRALVLYPPAGASAISAGVHVAENGRPVRGLSTALVAAANPGDFGVIVALQGSRSVPTAVQAAEVRSIGPLLIGRQAGQQIGFITYDRRASLGVPLSADTGGMLQTMRHLKSGPGTATADPGAAVALGVKTLQRARVALGGIILVTDGSGVSGSFATARATAIAANVPVITVPIADAHSTPAGMSAIRALGVSSTPTTTPSRAPEAVSLAWNTLQRATIVRWRSSESHGGMIDVAAHVDGVSGSVTASYAAPAASHQPAAHPATPPTPRQFPSGAALRNALAGAGRLSSAPSFIINPATVAPPAAVTPSTAAPAPVGFLDTTPGQLLIALLAGLLVGAAIFLLLHRPPGGAVRSRVGVFTPQSALVTDDAAAALDTGHQVEKTGMWADFVHNVEVSRNPRSPAELVKRGALFGAVAAVLFYLLSGTPLVAALALFGWPVVLRASVRRAAEKQRTTFRDTLPSYLQDLASAMRVGRSFVGALSVVSEGADEPTRSEFERAITDEQLGLPLEESLEAVARRMDASDMDQVALIASLNRRSGSNVAEALDRVAEGARDRADMRREVKALTAQAKMSSYVLSALPGFLLIGITFLSPRYAYPFFHTTVGFVVLGIGATLVLAGWKVMKKISNVRP